MKTSIESIKFDNILENRKKKKMNIEFSLVCPKNGFVFKRHGLILIGRLLTKNVLN